jgi:hypothetical protein
MIEVVDAIDRQVALPRPARRVVSLVPSETWSVAELAGLDRVVGRTDYCTEPCGRVESIPSVGGTKGFDVEAVKALAPDLVLANKEENSRPQVEAMIDAGLPVHVSFPCTVEESLSYLESLCVLLGVDPHSAGPVGACRVAVERAASQASESPVPVFVPIWKDPWMTFDERAYASDVLRVSGGANVFSSRARQYPLAADLGRREAWSEERVAGRDTRYPRIRLDEVVERGAVLALLPDEPYAFTEGDATELRSLGGASQLSVELVDGKDLFWYGTHVARAVERLGSVFVRFRSRSLGTSAHN